MKQKYHRIDWHPPFWAHNADDSDWCVLWIDVAKLDLAWQRDHSYVSRGGGGDGKVQKYEKVGDWVKSGRNVKMPDICLDRQGHVAFNDGRHRFAWLRDHGVTALPVAVSRDRVEEIRARFGTRKRSSLLLPTAG